MSLFALLALTRVIGRYKESIIICKASLRKHRFAAAANAVQFII